MLVATLPGSNCKQKEDDICGSNYKYKPDNKPIKNSHEVPKTRRKSSIKNEKKVARWELDEIFEQLRMKKKIEKNKIENIEDKNTVKETIESKQENINMKKNEDKLMKTEDMKNENDEKSEKMKKRK